MKISCIHVTRDFLSPQWAVLLLAVILVSGIGETSATIPQPKAPNFQYFERQVKNYFLKIFYLNISPFLSRKLFFTINRPKYRYPYYDENGRGKLLYGYGGPELYQYKTYSALEGIH